MNRISRILGVLADLGFHAFLAAYWYLVHALYPGYALTGAVLAYASFVLSRKRVGAVLPQPGLLLLAAIAFFLTLNPLQNLYGLGLLAWCVITAVVFRLCFAQLESATWKAGTLVASYVLFLALPTRFSAAFATLL